MIKIHPNLYTGGKADLPSTRGAEWVIVHATNSVRPKGEKPPRKPYIETEQELYLKWVDTMPDFYEDFGPTTFNKILDFIDKHIKDKKVFVHCDYGNSRGPTLGLLYLAKRAKTLSNTSYEEARYEFAKLYPDYYPGGIRVYVREHWDQIK